MNTVNSGHATLQVDYVPVHQRPVVLADPNTLAVIGFSAGARPVAGDDPRCLQIGLSPLDEPMLEVWRSSAPVTHGVDPDGLAWATDGDHLIGILQLDESDFENDIARTTENAYAILRQSLARHECSHLLRIWNYLDAIVDGEGDQERYRQFCIGRARGLGPFENTRLPAATAIGKLDGVRTLQMYWLASRAPGKPVENPRQVSAYLYPRQYGPQAPSFARAMLPPDGVSLPLMLSGTASVVGHESRHAGNTLRQLAETFANFDALLEQARVQQPALASGFTAGSRLKIYLENANELADILSALPRWLADDVPRMVLHARVCRPDLHLEIDGWHR